MGEKIQKIKEPAILETNDDNTYNNRIFLFLKNRIPIMINNMKFNTTKYIVLKHGDIKRKKSYIFVLFKEDL